MGRIEVSEFIDKNKNNWITSKFISNNIGISIRPVREVLKMMRKNNEVISKKYGHSFNTKGIIYASKKSNLSILTRKLYKGDIINS